MGQWKVITVAVAIVGFALWAAYMPASAQTESGKGDTPAVAKASSAFAMDLYAQLRQTSGNLFFSPYSVSTALAMTAAGSSGRTEQEMSEALKLSLDRERIHPAVGALIEQLKAPADAPYQLRIANRLWGQDGLDFRREFLQLTEKWYGAGLAQVDFARAAEAACRTINAWVEEQTAGLIEDLLQPNTVRGASLVLTNAVYFKGKWASPFDAGSTTNEPFSTDADKKVDVPMMVQEGRFGYLKSDGFAMLEMPYQGDKLSMLVLLPDDAAGLAKLESSLTEENLRGWTAKLVSRSVKVFLPRFELTCPLSLSGPLQALGMREAFSPERADFSRMIDPAEQAPIFISEVVHKAYVKVDEEGTEAAAATGVVMETTAMRDPPPVFRADHPFLFVIRERQTGVILFLGRLMDPSKPG